MNAVKKRNRLKTGIIPFAAAVCLFCAPLSVYADNSTDTILSDSQGLPVYTINMNDRDPIDTLKDEAIRKYISSSPTLTMADVNLDKSTMDNTAFDRTKEGLQTIQIKLSIAVDRKDGNADTYNYAETAAVRLYGADGPQIILKSDTMTIDLGSVFNYTDNIGYISTGNRDLPASIQESYNVDVNTEGTYNVTVTAYDVKGNKNTISYAVEVRKPAETVRAEQEQAEQAAAASNNAIANAGDTSGQILISGISGETGSAIADYALQFSGYSYVWGGTSPQTGFDCSGLTQYVYAHFGINLPRTAEAQAQCGTLIPASEAQPGDLVTYNGHAAIYIGNDMIINALNPSLGVGVSNMYALPNGNLQVHRLS